MSAPSVSVVIVNYNNFAWLRKSLLSVGASDLPQPEIIVVDNHSTEGDIQRLAQDFPSVRFLFLDTNTGFAHGVNVGVAAARSNFIFVLNNDAALSPHGWHQALDAFSREPRLAALQPKILIADTDRINNVGLAVNFLGFAWDAGYRQAAATNNSLVELAAFSGAAVILRKAALDDVGVFDEHYFMYHEDVDLACRLRLAKWKIMAEPSLTVEHAYSYKRSAQRYYWLERNRYFTLMKDFPAALLWLMVPSFLFMELGMLYFSVKNRWLGKKFLSYAAFLRYLPYLLKARHRVRHQMSAKEFLGGLVGPITFTEVQNPLLDRLANPVLRWSYAWMKMLLP